METTASVKELIELGLFDAPEQRLTEKGREYLRLLGSIEVQETADRGEAAGDLILSTSALIR